MNRQLTINEIAPYLSFDLQVMWGADKADLKGLIRNAVVLSGEFWQESQKTDITNIKPLLYPLSSLTNKDIQDEIMIRWGGGLSDKAKENWLKEVTDEMMYTAFNSLRYDFVELMLEKHIDLFGLIPDKLAIDKTTLNDNPTT